MTYGKRVLLLPASSDPYTQKYKGIWLCLAILTRALSGNYVNFGVFDLYGDRALKVSQPYMTLRSRIADFVNPKMVSVHSPVLQPSSLYPSIFVRGFC